MRDVSLHAARHEQKKGCFHDVRWHLAMSVAQLHKEHHGSLSAVCLVWFMREFSLLKHNVACFHLTVRAWRYEPHS